MLLRPTGLRGGKSCGLQNGPQDLREAMVKRYTVTKELTVISTTCVTLVTLDLAVGCTWICVFHVSVMDIPTICGTCVIHYDTYSGYRTVTLVTLDLAVGCTWVCVCRVSVMDIPTIVTRRLVSAG